jgi:hypothetical protein
MDCELHMIATSARLRNKGEKSRPHTHRVVHVGMPNTAKILDKRSEGARSSEQSQSLVNQMSAKIV